VLAVGVEREEGFLFGKVARERFGRHHVGTLVKLVEHCTVKDRTETRQVLEKRQLRWMYGTGRVRRERDEPVDDLHPDRTKRDRRMSIVSALILERQHEGRRQEKKESVPLRPIDERCRSVAKGTRRSASGSR
jgi:hypothetical protein